MAVRVGVVQVVLPVEVVHRVMAVQAGEDLQEEVVHRVKAVQAGEDLQEEAVRQAGTLAE